MHYKQFDSRGPADSAEFRRGINASELCEHSLASCAAELLCRCGVELELIGVHGQRFCNIVEADSVIDELCDVYVINTCTVTAESDRKARQLIRRAIKTNPEAYILVTGCMAEVFSDKLSKIEGIDYYLGTKEKINKLELLQKKLNRIPFIKFLGICHNIFLNFSHS